MFQRFTTVCLLFVAVALSVAAAKPLMETTAHRAIMYDRRFSAKEESKYGTRSVLLRGDVLLYNARLLPSSYKGATAYVPCAQNLTKSSLQHLFASGMKGLLVRLCEGSAANAEMLELYLSSTASEAPIYFLPETPSDLLEASLQAGSAHGIAGRTHVLTIGRSLRLTTMEPNATLPSPMLQGVLTHRAKGGKNGGAVPRVLVTSHFDTLGVAPSAAPLGPASGTVAAIELWRRATAGVGIASAQGSSPASSYGVTMLLGSTARFNYAGTSSWLAERPDKELDAYKLVISLDDVALCKGSDQEAEELYFHVQDAFLKRADGKRYAELAEEVAKEFGISLKVVASKTNYQHYDLRFEHEVFASRQMMAATLSVHRAHKSDQIFRGERVCKGTVTLQNQVDFIEELIRRVVSTEEALPPRMSWPGSSSYLAGLLEHSKTTPRSPVAEGGEAIDKYAAQVEALLRAHGLAVRSGPSSAVVTATHSRIRVPGITLYAPYEETLRVFAAAPFTVELLSALVAASLTGMFLAYEFGVQGLKELIA